MARLRNFAVVFLVLSGAFTFTSAKRYGGFGGFKSSSRHSYPSSHGLSGGGSHSYPHSGGLSGHGSGHQAHTQQHATQQHSQHPSGGGHSYPQSPGLSGHSNPSGGGHSYPNSPGLSGNGHSYGSGQQVHHHHYAYSPPQQIHYTPSHGAPVHYPVYHGPPPVYVQNFHDSGSRFSTLLTGLALYNLGRSFSHGHHSSSSAQRADAPGERCTLRIEQDRNLEIVKIPCYIISTFTDVNSVNKALNNTNLNSSVATIAAPANASVTPAEVSAVSTNTSVLSTLASANDTATNLSTTNDTAVSSSTIVNDTLMANGTEVHNVTQPEESGSTPVPLAAMPSSALPENTTTATVSTPMVTSQLSVTTPEPVKPEDVKGEPVKLSPTARCFVEHITPSSSSRKEVECGLLQQYAMQSMRPQQARVSAASYHGISVSCLLMTVAVFSNSIV